MELQRDVSGASWNLWKSRGREAVLQEKEQYKPSKGPEAPTCHAIKVTPLRWASCAVVLHTEAAPCSHWPWERTLFKTETWPFPAAEHP